MWSVTVVGSAAASASPSAKPSTTPNRFAVGLPVRSNAGNPTRLIIATRPIAPAALALSTTVALLHSKPYRTNAILPATALVIGAQPLGLPLASTASTTSPVTSRLRGPPMNLPIGGVPLGVVRLASDTPDHRNMFIVGD